MVKKLAGILVFTAYVLIFILLLQIEATRLSYSVIFLGIGGVLMTLFIKPLRNWMGTALEPDEEWLRIRHHRRTRAMQITTGLQSTAWIVSGVTGLIDSTAAVGDRIQWFLWPASIAVTIGFPILITMLILNHFTRPPDIDAITHHKLQALFDEERHQP